MQARSQKQSLHPSLGGVKFVQQGWSRLSLPDNFKEENKKVE